MLYTSQSQSIHYLGESAVSCCHLSKAPIDAEELEPKNSQSQLFSSQASLIQTYQSSTFSVVGAVGPLRELLLQLSS